MKLKHPTFPGMFTEVSDEQSPAWLEQGWLTGEPKAARDKPSPRRRPAPKKASPEKE